MKLSVAILSFFISLITYGNPWYQKFDFTGDARHRSTAFSIGTEGYIGLGHINSAVDVEYDDFWKYNPASNSWSQIANFPDGKCYHAAAFVINGKAYVGTGRKEDGSYSKRFFEYNPLTNSWTAIADLPGVARRGAVCFSVNGKGYCGTGQTTSGYSTDFYQYDPSNNQWTICANFPGIARTSAVAFAIGDFGYLGTGDSNSGSTNDFYQYNPSSNQWIQKAQVGPSTRQEACGFVVNGKGYIGTGDDYSSGNNFSDFWEYNPINETWTQIEDFSGTARRYLVGLTIGSRAYVGTGTNGTNFKDFWMFDRNLSLLEKKLESVNLSIYPNPCAESCLFDFHDRLNEYELAQLNIQLVSLDGSVKVNHKVSTNQTKIDTKHLKSGCYLYSIESDHFPLKTGQLIIVN
jgi:N-acetylneuraminic acid mutarotase